MNPRRLLARITSSRNNVRFSDLVRLCRALGFERDRQRGSHQMFYHSAIRVSINLQNDRGQAKPYQVEQLLKIIEEHSLTLGEVE